MTNIKDGCQQYNTQVATIIKEMCASVTIIFSVELLLT